MGFRKSSAKPKTGPPPPVEDEESPTVRMRNLGYTYATSETRHPKKKEDKHTILRRIYTNMATPYHALLDTLPAAHALAHAHARRPRPRRRGGISSARAATACMHARAATACMHPRLPLTRC